jgi:hypothetical protein
MVESPEFVEQPKNRLVDRIWRELENSEDRRSVSLPRRYRQLAILRNLPQDFEAELKGFATYVEHQTDLPLDRMLQGEIFEELVRADTEICPTPETQEAVLIRSLLKEPTIYGLQDEGIDVSVRNPDVARVDKEGKIVGAVEVKSGRIDRRGMSQIGTFRHNLENLVQKLEAISPQTLREHGLSLIAEKLDQLQVSDDFAVTVAVPSGSYGDNVSNLIKEEAFSARERETVKNQLSQCRIVESPFSRSDLKTVLNCVLEWLPVSLPTPV